MSLSDQATLEQVKALVATWKPEAFNGQPMIVSWHTALSNMDWTDYATGLGVCYRNRRDEHAMLLCDVAQLHRSDAGAERCLYIVDGGANPLPFYTAGWCYFDTSSRCRNGQFVPGGYVLLHQMTGHRGLRVGGMGPRRTWHLMTSPIAD